MLKYLYMRGNDIMERKISVNYDGKDIAVPYKSKVSDILKSLNINDNKISIDFHVIVSYGVSISAVSDNLIESVKYRVEEFTGMEVEKINIYVEGVRVID